MSMETKPAMPPATVVVLMGLHAVTVDGTPVISGQSIEPPIPGL
jgi:hypothetical protein